MYLLVLFLVLIAILDDCTAGPGPGQLPDKMQRQQRQSSNPPSSNTSSRSSRSGSSSIASSSSSRSSGNLLTSEEYDHKMNFSVFGPMGRIAKLGASEHSLKQTKNFRNKPPRPRSRPT